MPFPLVGRAALDQANAELGRVYDLLRHERDRNAALMLEIVTLRRDGFMKPAPAQTVPDEPRQVGEQMGDGIDEAIEHYASLASNHAAARRALQKYAIRLRVTGQTTEQIIAAIHRGDPTTGEDDE